MAVSNPDHHAPIFNLQNFIHLGHYCSVTSIYLFCLHLVIKCNHYNMFILIIIYKTHTHTYRYIHIFIYYIFITLPNWNLMSQTNPWQNIPRAFKMPLQNTHYKWKINEKSCLNTDSSFPDLRITFFKWMQTHFDMLWSLAIKKLHCLSELLLN